MRRIHRVILLTAVLGLMSALAGCSNFDPDNLDVFGLNEKKKLPGERKDVFPEGVPGVTQGIPPEYLNRGTPPAETALASPDGAAGETKTAAAPPAEEAKPKAKPKPKPRVATRPTRVMVQPAAQEQQPAAAWPEQQQQQQQQQPAAQSSWPAQNQSSSTAPWPSSPAPGTFSKQ